MNNCAFTGYEYFLAVAFLSHLALGIYSLIQIFVSMGNGCWQAMSFLFLVTSIAVLCTIVLVFKLKKSNLFDLTIRAKYKYCLIAVCPPVLLNMLFSVLWWGQSDQNPVYCSLITQLKLSNKLGILYEVYSLIIGAIYVSALRAYTKRKFFLIAIGGPQNQVVRGDHVPNIQLNDIINQLNQELRNQNQQEYQNFEDNLQLPQIPGFKSEPYIQQQGQIGNAQCYICLTSFKQQSNVKVIRTICGHIFHNDCARKWLLSDHHQCPNCRTLLF